MSAVVGMPRVARRIRAKRTGELIRMDQGSNAPGGTSATQTGEQRERMSEQPTVRVGVATEITDKQRHARMSQARDATLGTTPAGRDVNGAMIGIIVLIVAQTGLLFMTFVPSRITLRLGWSSVNGPFPASVAPVVTLAFYLLPFLIGFLAKRWETAVFSATLPAWLSLGIYIAGTSIQSGVFAFLKGQQPGYLVQTLELFAALGAFGWLARRVLFTKSVTQ